MWSETRRLDRGDGELFSHRVRKVTNDGRHFEQCRAGFGFGYPADDGIPDRHHSEIDSEDKRFHGTAGSVMVCSVAQQVSEQRVITVKRFVETVECRRIRIAREAISSLQ